MFNIFKKTEKKILNVNNSTLKIAALLIHAAKIDENYSDIEKEIIKKTLIKLGSKEKNLEEILKNAENIEAESNQILEFTREIKNLDEETKKKIIESLWNIIYSDNLSNMYESNLMRRLSGLLYLDIEVVGNLKEKVKSNLKK